MKLSCTPFTVHKRVALTISQGTTAESINLWVRIEADGLRAGEKLPPFLWALKLKPQRDCSRN
jgi:hypothetical protein